MPLITGTIQDESEALYVGPVYFRNLDAPCSAGSRVTGPGEVSLVIGSSGNLPTGFRLAPGRTRITVNSKSREFTVPQGGGTYDLASLMANSLRTRVIIDADTIAELREYQSSSSNFRACITADANGQYAIFKWDATATNADDGASYVRPNDFSTAGLWVRIQ